MQRRRVARDPWVAVPGEDPLWVTSAVTTVLDCCRTLRLAEAVAVCDSALRSGQVSMAELRRAAGRLRGHRHAARTRRVLDLADPECGSVLESVLRVLRFTWSEVVHDPTAVLDLVRAAVAAGSDDCRFDSSTEAAAA